MLFFRQWPASMTNIYDAVVVVEPNRLTTDSEQSDQAPYFCVHMNFQILFLNILRRDTE